MRNAFLNTPDDIQWLKDTCLKGVILPTAWSGFQSAIMQGREDSPYAVNLYLAQDPLYSANYYRVRFVNDSGAYAECCEYSGGNDSKPLGGLSPLR